MPHHLPLPYKLFFVSCFFGLILLGSCSGSDSMEDTKPQISNEKFKTVLVDIHLAESLLQDKKHRKKDDTTKFHSTIEDYYKLIFEMNEISREEFEETFEYFAARPDSFDFLYEKVIAQLMQLETNIKKDIKSNNAADSKNNKTDNSESSNSSTKTAVKDKPKSKPNPNKTINTIMQKTKEIEGKSETEEKEFNFDASSINEQKRKLDAIREKMKRMKGQEKEIDTIKQ